MASAAVAEEALASSPNHAEIRLGLVSAHGSWALRERRATRFTRSTARTYRWIPWYTTRYPRRRVARRHRSRRICAISPIAFARTPRRISGRTSRGRTKTARTCKALEFVSFRERLRDSHASAAMRGVRARANRPTRVRGDGRGERHGGCRAGRRRGVAARARRRSTGFPTPPRGSWPPRANASRVARVEDLATNPARESPAAAAARGARRRGLARVRRVVVPAGGLDDRHESRTGTDVPRRRRGTLCAKTRCGGEDPPRARRACSAWSRAPRRRARWIIPRGARGGGVIVAAGGSARRRRRSLAAVANLVALFAEEERPPRAACRGDARAGVGGGGCRQRRHTQAALASLVGRITRRRMMTTRRLPKSPRSRTRRRTRAPPRALAGSAARTGDSAARGRSSPRA